MRVLCNGQFSSEAYERVHPLGIDAQRAGQGVGPIGDRLDRIGRGRLIQALHRRFNGARDAGRVGAGEAFRDSVGNPFGDVGAPEVAKDIGGHAPGRRDPTLQALAADCEQRDLLSQNGDSPSAEAGACSSDGRRLGLRDLDRRFAGREAGRKPIRRRVGAAGKLAALLYRIKPLNDLVKTGQAVADEGSGDCAIAPANHRQDVLGGVHRAPHRREIDDAGAPFERVKCAERAIQTRAVSRLALQRQKVGGGLLDELARLHQKLFEELVHAGSAAEHRHGACEILAPDRLDTVEIGARRARCCDVARARTRCW